MSRIRLKLIYWTIYGLTAVVVGCLADAVTHLIDWWHHAPGTGHQNLWNGIWMFLLFNFRDHPDDSLFHVPAVYVYRLLGLSLASRTEEVIRCEPGAHDADFEIEIFSKTPVEQCGKWMFWGMVAFPIPLALLSGVMIFLSSGELNVLGLMLPMKWAMFGCFVGFSVWAIAAWRVLMPDRDMRFLLAKADAQGLSKEGSAVIAWERITKCRIITRRNIFGEVTDLYIDFWDAENEHLLRVLVEDAFESDQDKFIRALKRKLNPQAR